LIEQTRHEQPGPFAPPSLQGLQHYYGPVRRRARRRYSVPHGFGPLGTLPGTHPQTFLQVGRVRARLLLFHTEAADQARVACMPDTAWPISGHPPGSSRDSVDTPVLMSFQLSTRPQRFAFARLPDPYLTPLGRLFLIVHHDGLQPTQHEVVWSLPPQGDSEGPNLHLPCSTASESSSYISLPLTFRTQQPFFGPSRQGLVRDRKRSWRSRVCPQGRAAPLSATAAGADWAGREGTNALQKKAAPARRVGTGSRPARAGVLTGPGTGAVAGGARD
jgi:hypothetical protein